jgi:hypothetical protein|tara:strand:+ start:506 stop:748 length:243 start_codon:yes stop_codon:yes gene_type:complete
MEVGQYIYVEQDDCASVVEGDEAARITHISEGHESDFRPGHKLCYIEWVNRPLKHQRNGAFRPSTQVWVPAAITCHTEVQ